MADPFDVWGRPRHGVLAKLTHAQQNELRRYVDRVTSKCYRLAFDLGVERGIDSVRDAATALYAARVKKRSR